MKKIIASAIASLALFGASAHAVPYLEQGDAGNTKKGAQHVGNNVTQIKGALSTTDLADIYRFNWNGGAFEANTISTPFDAMLFLFEINGTKVAFNDDYYGLQSRIALDLKAGNYLLGINRFSFNYDGDLAGLSATGTGHVGPNSAYTINIVDTVEVPEPASLGLFAMAAAGLAFARRRRQG